MAAPVRLSLIRRQTWMGGDRRIVGVGMIIGILLGWMLMNSYGWFYALPIGAFFWLGGIWMGRELVASDPYAFDVWRRHIRYKKYYSAGAHHASPVPKVKDFI
ncbi:VirB3 family type IV secretion system protein [Glaciimonas sp. GG7]